MHLVHTVKFTHGECVGTKKNILKPIHSQKLPESELFLV